MAYHAKVAADYEQHRSDDSHRQTEKVTPETATTVGRGLEAELPDGCRTSPENRQWGKDQLAESPQATEGGDVPDDPRNHNNPKTGRFDASWSTYDRAIDAARKHSGGDLGQDSLKMYDFHHQTREGTGTLIGEQTSDKLRGWRIDGRDGHVNWWDWTGGKKGAGGVYGHDWFPEDPSTPGSRYIGWAPWQDSSGKILEGS